LHRWCSPQRAAPGRVGEPLWHDLVRRHACVRPTVWSWHGVSTDQRHRPWPSVPPDYLERRGALQPFCSVMVGGLRTDGSFPAGGLVMDNCGNLYGTAPGQGSFEAGVVFELTPIWDRTKWTETPLHTFCYPANCTTDGEFPPDRSDRGQVREPLRDDPVGWRQLRSKVSLRANTTWLRHGVQNEPVTPTPNSSGQARNYLFFGTGDRPCPRALFLVLEPRMFRRPQNVQRHRIAGQHDLALDELAEQTAGDELGGTHSGYPAAFRRG